MISNILNNPKVLIAVGAVVAAVGIWAKTSAVAMPIFPIIGITFGFILIIHGSSKLKGYEYHIWRKIRAYTAVLLVLMKLITICSLKSK